MSVLSRCVRYAMGCFAALALMLGWVSVAWAATSDTAEAVLYSTQAENLALGVAHLAETAAGLDIQMSFLGAPSGTHGFHIHAGDSCADGGNAAGGHYNPDGVEHGYLIEDGFAAAHAGDLGNVVIGEDGTALYTALVPGLTLVAGDHPVANHAFILHADPDDFSQPTGNAGSRAACGVIALD